MKTRHILLLLFVGAALLAACKDKTVSVPVFVTPTPQAGAVLPTGTPTGTPTQPPTNTPTTAPTDTPTPTITPSATPTLDATQSRITPQPTPVLLPNATYGAVIPENYTPPPRFTPLPQTIQERPCVAMVTAADVTFYTAPDAAGDSSGTAANGEALSIRRMFTDANGITWAEAGQGWFVLSDSDESKARLNNVRACLIAQGALPPTTLAGLHVSGADRRDEVLNVVGRMVDSGRPLGTLKGLAGSEDVLNAVKFLSPYTTIIYRARLSDEWLHDCPADADTQPDAVTAARAWMDRLMPRWQGINADYFEYMNECEAPAAWIADFSIEAMRIAAENNYCLLLFSYGVGRPDLDEFDALLPAYQYAAENPCRPNSYHGISLHVYSLYDWTFFSTSDVWVTFRHRLFHQRLLDALPEAANLPVFLTEVAQGSGQLGPACEDITRDTLQYTFQLEEDPYVRGFHLLNFGTGTPWADLTGCLDTLANGLIEYYAR